MCGIQKSNLAITLLTLPSRCHDRHLLLTLLKANTTKKDTHKRTNACVRRMNKVENAGQIDSDSLWCQKIIIE